MERKFEWLKEFDRDFEIDYCWQDERGNDHDTATFSLHGRQRDDDDAGYVRLKHPDSEEMVIDLEDAQALYQNLGRLLRAMKLLHD